MKNLKAIRAHSIQLGDTFVFLKGPSEAQLVEPVSLRWSDAFNRIVVTGVTADLAMLEWDEVVYIVPPKVMAKFEEDS